MKRILIPLLFRARAVGLLLASTLSAQANPAPPAFVVSRVGDGITPLGSGGNMVFLESRDAEGNLLRSTPLGGPAEGARFVVDGTDLTQGALSRSEDGRVLWLGGYDKPQDFPLPLQATAGNTLTRILARIDENDGVDFLAAPAGFASPGGPRSVVGLDGTRLWLADSSGGVFSLDAGTGEAGEILRVPMDWQRLVISGGRLYGSSAAPSPGGIHVVGEGLPVSSSTAVRLPGLPEAAEPTDFAFLDSDPDLAGPDVLYVADRARGLVKYVLDRSGWLESGVSGDGAEGYRGLAVLPQHDRVVLFAIRGSQGGELVMLHDASGGKGLLTGQPEVIAQAAAGTFYAGLAPAPYHLPELTVEASAPARVLSGAAMEYQLLVRNDGNATAEGVVVTFVLPEGFERLETSLQGGFEWRESSGDLLVFSGGVLGAGESAALRIQVRPLSQDAFVAFAGPARVDPEAMIPERDEDNNSSTGLLRTAFVVDPAPVRFEWAAAEGGSWSAAANWRDGMAPGASGSPEHSLRFAIPGSFSAENDLPGDFLLNELDFAGSSARLTGGLLRFSAGGMDSARIQQRSGRPVVISNPIRLDDTSLVLHGGGGGAVFLNGPIDGSGSLVKDSAGLAVVAAQAGHEGSTVVKRGTLALAAPGAVSGNSIHDGGFEQPYLPNSAWSISPLGAAWDFTAEAGIAAGAAAGEGFQAAFLQGPGSALAQTVTVPAEGQYLLQFSVSRGGAAAANGLRVLVDGSVVALVRRAEIVGNETFFPLQIRLLLPAGSHNIRFEAWESSGEQDITLLDDVSLMGPAGALPQEGAVILEEAGAVLDFGSAPQRVGSLAGVEGSMVRLDGDLHVGGNDVSTEFAGVMSGQGRLIKEGLGDLVLVSPVGISGGFTVRQGTLTLRSVSPAWAAGALVVQSGARLHLDFQGTQQVGSFAVGQTPLAPGLYHAGNSSGAIFGTGTLQVMSAALPPRLVAETVEGLRLPNGGTLDFGMLPAGDAGAHWRTLRIRNIGGSPVGIDGAAMRVSVDATGAYEVVNWTARPGEPAVRVLSPGAAAYVSIRFTTGQPGLYPARLTIPTNNRNVPGITLELSAAVEMAPSFVQEPGDVSIPHRGSATLVAVPAGIPAPDMQWYQVVEGQLLRIEGATAAAFTTARLMESARYLLRLSNPSGTVDSREVLVSVAAAADAALAVFDDAGGAVASGDVRPFGRAVVLEGAVARRFAVANAGGGDPLVGLEITLGGPQAGDFQMEREELPASLGPAEQGFFRVLFQPKAEGSRSATLSIASNDPARDPFVIEVSGEGFIPVPQVATQPAQPLTPFSATLHGSVTLDTLPGEVWFEYDRADAQDFAFSWPLSVSPTAGPEPQGVRATIGGLSPGTRYKVRLVASNAYGTRYGQTLTFTTDALPFLYEIHENEVVITGYTGDGGVVTVPQRIEDLPVVRIGDHAFFNVAGITHVAIPEGVRSIGGHAFASCANLAGVTLPESLRTIGTQAFADCPKLEAIVLPAAVDSLGDGAFANGASLQAITVAEGNEKFASVDGVLFDKEITRLVQYPAGRMAAGGYEVPAGVVEISPQAFRGALGLTGVVLPEGLAGIGSHAFADCGDLAEVLFLGDAPEIGEEVFRHAAEGFSVRFLVTSTGFTTPLWEGWPARPVEAAPVIREQPRAVVLTEGQEVFVLTVSATGHPAPTYQWFRGDSGDTSVPVSPVRDEPDWSLPRPAAATRYWVRVANPLGVVFSDTAEVRLPANPSDRADLSSLHLSVGELTPAFAPEIMVYAVSVPHEVAEIFLTAVPAAEGAALKVREQAALSGEPSGPHPLVVGENRVEIEVIPPVGESRTYVLAVHRAPAPSVVTLPAEGLSSKSARLMGQVVPGGSVSVFFEYGESESYGQRTPERIVEGLEALPFEAVLAGLKPATTYHFRALASGPAGVIGGLRQTFTTPAEGPVVATGDPFAVTGRSATLVGAVDPKGLPTQVWFEYGLTPAYGRSTQPRTINAAGGVLDVLAPSQGFIGGATYHYRIAASNEAGTSYGEDVAFTVVEGSGAGSPAPHAAPAVSTGGVLAVQATSAILLGNTNPNGGTTLARFEYGTSASFGFQSPVQGAGNGVAGVAVSIPLTGLQADTTYHYRLVSTNSLGSSEGEVRTFTTAAAPPQAITGDAEILGTTRVRVHGSAKSAGPATMVFFDYGTDPDSLSLSVAADPAGISGPDAVALSATLENLGQGITFFYRVRAVAPGGVTAVGETQSFSMGTLSGLLQQFPSPVGPDERRGTLNLVIDPPVAASGWRFLGERVWREPGLPATGLTAGDRVIEFRPVAGFSPPPNEPVNIPSDGNPLADLVRGYLPDGGGATGAVTVTLRPEGITGDALPFERLAAWAIFGEVDEAGVPVWRASGSSRSGLPPGNHLVVLKAVEGRATPAPVTVRIRAGETTDATLTYYVAAEEVGSPPARLGFETLSADAALPHGFIGQLRGDSGSGTGFVVRPGVVATAAHVMFDDGTLSSATGVQWLHRLDPQTHDPLPLTPRGYYMLTGYAAQRRADDSPGISTPASQNLDAAAVYFAADPGEGGFSGYLASDTAANEFLESDALKTLAGYPVEGIAATDLNHPHATPPAAISFTRAFGRTYTTPDIRATGGVSGGPLSVRHANGLYYPSAIYLGGTRQTVVRAIDSDVVALFGFAEASAGLAGGDTRGGIMADESFSNGSAELGGLEVRIEPAAAREAGAGWRIQAGAPWYGSGASLAELSPNTYSLRFATVPGFSAPTTQAVEIQAGFLRRITFRYEAILVAPEITPLATIDTVRGQPFQQVFSAANSPEAWSLQGALPAGLAFDPAAGRLTGTPSEAGAFPLLLGASNPGGADSRTVTLRVLPALSNQSLTVPVDVPMSYSIPSSESGAGVLYAADDLPSGLTLDPASGVISGTPAEAGTFFATLHVTRRGATATAVLEMNVTGEAPAITSHSALDVTVPYLGEAVLSLAATGSPAPSYQWYLGLPGDVSQPIENAATATFTSPPLTRNSTFWARVSSISGGVDSPAFRVAVLPSDNPRLASLEPSAGRLSPAFHPDIAAYTLEAPFEVSQLTLTPTAWVPQSVIELAGAVVSSGSASVPLALSVGPNAFEIRVTAGNGIATRVYRLTVQRGAPPEVATLAAAEVTDRGARLRGTARPNGNARVFFEFGPSEAYGYSTAPQEISGTSTLDLQAVLSGLPRSSRIHFRLVLANGAGTFYGENRSFETLASAPVVATGDASDVTDSEVRLIGAVDTNGSPVTVYFEWGETPAYGFTTPQQVLPAGAAIADVQFTATGLVPGRTYHYRLVALSAEATVFGENVTFVAGNADGGSGIPAAPPLASTLGSADVTAQSATLIASANPNGGTTFVHFEYGPTPSYGSVSETRSLGNGQDLSVVAIPIADLAPGTTYHFRAVAANSSGRHVGENASFTTAFPPPLALTGEAAPLGSASARLSGVVRARGTAAEVFFEYGTDGSSFPNRIRATPGTVNGSGETTVTADLTGLAERVTIHYRLSAARPADPSSQSIGETRTLQADALAGLIQQFTREVPSNSREASLLVRLLPAGTGAWRFVGETVWRPSGVAVDGLTNGDRLIEFLPVPGFIAPPLEQVGVVNGEAPVMIERLYYETPEPANASLTVQLTPESIAGSGVALAERAQWRVAGESAWRNSGTTAAGLPPGSYIVEFKAVPGRNKPPGAAVTLVNGSTTLLKMAYPPAAAPLLSPPGVVPYATSSSDHSLPYAYVGEFRTDAGSQSGFVVKPRVVATTASAIFNDTTLSLNTGMQWLLQRDAGTFEPTPQSPRGAYVFTGYAEQRVLENTPGTLATASMNLNAAALYFFEDAGRGGFSGYLSSDLQENPHLRSAAPKTLVGYPVNGVADAVLGRMHATPPSAAAFVWETGRTFSSASIRGFGGMEGGPLCVRFQEGAYFPAGIYVGGGSRGMVRAIDGAMIDMFNRAETSGNGGDNNTGGGITQSSFSSIGSTSSAALKVVIQPSSARTAGAGWRLSPETSYRLSGSQRTGLSPGSYRLEMRPLDGYAPPVVQNVQLSAGNLLELTYSYEEANAAPTIQSLADQVLPQDSAGLLLDFTVFDVNHPAASLSVSSSSGNPALLPESAISLGGSGMQRSVFLKPAAGQSGSALVTLTVSDGALSASTHFTVRVESELDAWRLVYFGTSANTGDAADQADPDGDGVRNLDEFTAGTHPNDPSDVFRVTSVQRGENSFGARISGKSGRRYTLQRAASPAAGAWTDVTQTGPLAGDGPVFLSDPAPPAGRAFYRVAVERQAP